MIDELRVKYQEVAGLFEKYLTEAEDNRDQLESDLNDLKQRIQNKSQENVTHKNDIDQSERIVQELQRQILNLTGEIEQIKQQNESSIRGLDQERVKNETVIADLKKQLFNTEHEFQKTQILIEKQKNEIEFINQEQEKFRSSSYAERVDLFKDYIEESTKKTEQMKNELDALKREWDAKLKKAGQKTDQLLDQAIKGGKLDELAEELKRKQRDL